MASRRRGEYSEKDVLEVLRLMKAAYNVDDSRIYLMGHSMGAIGTWALGSKYAQTWAALVAFSGVGQVCSNVDGPACYSSFCQVDAGTCAAKLPVSGSCTSNAQCASNRCLNLDGGTGDRTCVMACY